MAATNVSFRWLDILEKEFDKSFVSLDLMIGEVDQFDVDEAEFQVPARHRLESLSSCFAQLTHKAQTVFQANAKLEAELVHLRQESAESRAFRDVAAAESRELLTRLHSSQLQLHSVRGSASTEDSDKIRERLDRELIAQREKNLKACIGRHEVEILRKENDSLRRYILGLQGELYGAKLAAKYLDKELAGRIQQIQLLGRDLSGEENDKLWHQLEAEIHLHRHKTVVRACRNRYSHNSQVSTDAREDGAVSSNGMARPSKQQQRRTVVLKRTQNEGLGMSVTGGREHGVPVLISVIHPDTPASRSGELYVGDAILSVNGLSLKEANHAEAVQLLSTQEETVTLKVVYVSPEEDDDDDSLFGDPCGFKYKIFDEDVVSQTSSQMMPNGRLSRASIDSVRGSTDMLADSPRRRMDVNAIDESREETLHQNGIAETHAATNGVEEMSNGFGCDDAVSQEILNGTGGRLEFHSDVGSEDEGIKSSESADNALVEVACEALASKVREVLPEEPQQNGVSDAETGSHDVGDVSVSVRDTLDSVTESSLSSPSIEECDDENRDSMSPPDEIELKTSVVFNTSPSIEECDDENRDSMSPPDEIELKTSVVNTKEDKSTEGNEDVIFNGTY